MTHSVPAKTPVPAARKMAEYKIGDRDERPWGYYMVNAVGRHASGEEYCKKLIVVKPGQILSLQSHEQRRETWTVVSGTLEVLLDGRRITMQQGKTVHIPQRSIHCMANLSKDNCIVEEMQEGICREDDITRYVDAYNRAAADGTEAPTVQKSRDVYNQILADIRRGKKH